MHGARTIGLAAVLMMVAGVSAQPVTEPKEPAPAAKTPAQPAKALTVKEKLQASAKVYAEAKTYRDEGVVTMTLEIDGRKTPDEKPFSTAFERDGRFMWEFRSSPAPGGKPTSRYAVWSKDQKSFESRWDLTRTVETHDTLEMAMAAPTGISSGSATAIIPLLRPDMQWGISLLRLNEPIEKGTEKLDGVECTLIEAKGFDALDGDSGYHAIKLWLDPALLIRKVSYSMDFKSQKDPDGGRDIPKFTAHTVMTFKPVLNEPIEAKAFEPPAKK